MGEHPFQGGLGQRVAGAFKIAFDFIGVRDGAWYDEWMKNNTANDYWQRNAYDQYERVRAPAFQAAPAPVRRSCT